MRKNSKNNFGFTLAELAATLGVFALAATILTPAFSGAPAISNSNVTVSNEAPAGASPFTPPVNAILVDVTNDATGVTVQKTVTDPNATSTTISGLDPQAEYTVAVAKQNQAGKSPAAVAKVNYIKVGETVVDTTRVEKQNRDNTSKPIMVDDPNDRKYVNGAPTAWAKVWNGQYGTRVEQYPRYEQRTTTPVYKTVNRSAQIRVAPFERTVRVAPFTRSVRVAPYERTTYVPASSYTYSCQKSRQVTERCGSTTVSYTYQGTCTRTKSVPCGTESYTYSSTCSYSYNCGTTKKPKTCSSSYSCTKTGTRTKYCSVSENYSCTKTGTTTEPKYCTSTEYYTGSCTGTTAARYDTVAVYNYANEDVYNYETEAVYNYRTDNWTEQVQDGTTTSSSVQEGTCAANGSVGSWTGVVYGCSDLGYGTRTVTDYSKKIMVDDKSNPIAWEQVFAGLGKKHSGQYEQMEVEVVIPGTRIDDVFASRTTQQAVKADAGQLLLNVSSVQNVKGAWKSATVAAKGAGTSQTVGSRVNFTRAKLVTLNGTQYLVVDARAAR
jgi:hypothetical protein